MSRAKALELTPESARPPAFAWPDDPYRCGVQRLFVAPQEKMKHFAADVHTYLVGGARFDMAAPLPRTITNGSSRKPRR